MSARLLGMLTGSLAVFLIGLTALLAADLVAGNIRPPRR
jgi:hypothetical protein